MKKCGCLLLCIAILFPSCDSSDEVDIGALKQSWYDGLEQAEQIEAAETAGENIVTRQEEIMLPIYVFSGLDLNEYIKTMIQSGDMQPINNFQRMAWDDMISLMETENLYFFPLTKTQYYFLKKQDVPGIDELSQYFFEEYFLAGHELSYEQLEFLETDIAVTETQLEAVSAYYSDAVIEYLKKYNILTYTTLLYVFFESTDSENDTFMTLRQEEFFIENNMLSEELLDKIPWRDTSENSFDKDVEEKDQDSRTNPGPKYLDRIYVEHVPQMRIECPDCEGGNKKIPCKSCNGEGTNTTTYPGQVLPGGLVMPPLTVALDCIACEAGNAICTRCYGTGEITNSDFITYMNDIIITAKAYGINKFVTKDETQLFILEECFDCNGHSEVTCYSCNGAGKKTANLFVGSGYGDNGSSYKTVEESCSLCFGDGEISCGLCYGFGQRIIYQY